MGEGRGDEKNKAGARKAFRLFFWVGKSNPFYFTSPARRTVFANGHQTPAFPAPPPSCHPPGFTVRFPRNGSRLEPQNCSSSEQAHRITPQKNGSQSGSVPIFNPVIAVDEFSCTLFHGAGSLRRQKWETGKRQVSSGKARGCSL